MATLVDIQALGATTPVALLEAQLAGMLAAQPSWPRLDVVLPRLGTSHALFVRTAYNFSDETVEVLSVYFAPPDGVAVQRTWCSETQRRTLQRLRGSRDELAQVSRAAVDELVAGLMPVHLRERLHAGEVPELVIVPCAELWTVPWHASPTLAATSVSVAPSLSMWTSLTPGPGPISSVQAVVDESIIGVEALVAALDAAADNGLVIHRARSRAQLEPTDLLVLYCHGAGEGLSYRLATPGGTVTAAELASARLARQALVVACWSAGAPPVAVPISLPVAMLLTGAATVAGGLWPLPAVAAGELAADVVERISRHRVGLGAAVQGATLARSDAVLHGAGIAVFGRHDRG